MAKKKKRISEKISNTKYTIYTDGGCAYNPGGPGGIGVVVINNETKECPIKYKYFILFFKISNNEIR